MMSEVDRQRRSPDYKAPKGTHSHLAKHLLAQSSQQMLPLGQATHLRLVVSALRALSNFAPVCHGHTTYGRRWQIDKIHIAR